MSLAIIALNHARLSSIIGTIERSIPERSARISEAVAAGLGFTTRAAILSRLSSGPLEAEVDPDAFERRLLSLTDDAHVAAGRRAFVFAVGLGKVISTESGVSPFDSQILVAAEKVTHCRELAADYMTIRFGPDGLFQVASLEPTAREGEVFGVGERHLLVDPLRLDQSTDHRTLAGQILDAFGARAPSFAPDDFRLDLKRSLRRSGVESDPYEAPVGDVARAILSSTRPISDFVGLKAVHVLAARLVGISDPSERRKAGFALLSIGAFKLTAFARKPVDDIVELGMGDIALTPADRPLSLTESLAMARSFRAKRYFAVDDRRNSALGSLDAHSSSLLEGVRIESDPNGERKSGESVLLDGERMRVESLHASKEMALIPSPDSSSAPFLAIIDENGEAVPMSLARISQGLRNLT